MEQKGSKIQEARNFLKSKSGPESSHSGADFGTGKEPLARQKLGAESACAGPDFEAQEEPSIRQKSGAERESSGTDFAQTWAFGFVYFAIRAPNVTLRGPIFHLPI